MFKMKSLHVALGGALLLAASALSAQITVKSGEKIAFLGDSITQQGNWESGYINLVMSALEANGIKAVKIPAGISGHKSNQMLARLERDVLKKKPQIMTLSCGVNDVWHGRRGVSLEDYRKNITEITSTMIYENPDHANNKKLAAYNDFLRSLAKEKNCVLVDLNADMQKQIAEIKAKHPKIKGNLLTVDGVHMNVLGNIMMAEGILRAFGLNGEQIAKAEAVWDKKTFPQGFMRLTVKEYKTLSEKAFKVNKSVPDYVTGLAKKDAQAR